MGGRDKPREAHNSVEDSESGNLSTLQVETASRVTRPCRIGEALEEIAQARQSAAPTGDFNEAIDTFC